MIYWFIYRWMKDEEKMSRILVTQMDAGNLHIVRRNAVYERLSQRLEELRVEYVARQRTRSRFLMACSNSLARLRVPQVDAVVNQPAVNNAPFHGPKLTPYWV